MESFMQTLLTMTAAASVAALAVMVLRLPLKKAPRWLTCVLWGVVLFRMVCPVSFEAPVSLLPPAIAQGTYTEVLETAEPVQPAPAVPVEPQSERPVSDPVSVTPSVPQGPSLSQVLFVLWAAGAAGMFLRGAAGYVRLRRQLADGVRAEDNVYLTDRVDTPFVCGFLRPRVYLPAGLDEAHRNYVLLHEKAHIRRLDHLMKPLAWVALCLHWFNPVLHLAFRLYCRDVETACDQSVIRSFGRADTAGYAEALLHLGYRKTSLPQGVSLAFGEENAKGRIKHILDYKHPNFFVVPLAVAGCVIGAVVILANPGNPSDQLEGYGITQVHAIRQGLQVQLPPELGAELVSLLEEHGHEDYTYLASYEAEEGILALTGQTDGTVYFFDPSNETLIRINHDGYSSQRKKAPMHPSLAEDPDYLAWKEEAQTYLETGRADALFALKTPYVGDNSAVGEILGAMGMGDILGDFTFELQTDTEPYGITICIPHDFPLLAPTAYYHAAADLLLALVDNAGTVSFRNEKLYDGSTEWSLTPSEKVEDLTIEEFRVLFDRHQEAAAEYLGKLAQREYRVLEVVYLSPEVYPGVANIAAAYEASTFTIARDEFSATLVNALSSAWPETETFSDIYYLSAGGLDALTPLAEELELNSDRFIHGEGWLIRTEEEGDTGYRVYRLLYHAQGEAVPDQVYLVGHATYSPEAQALVLDSLFRVTPEG